MHEIRCNHRIAIDHAHRILDEYFRHAPADSHAGQWLRTILSRSNKTVFRTGSVPAENRIELVNDLHFDVSDLVFVGTCFEGPDKLLVAEESDYTEAIKAYLLQELGVSVLSVSDALVRAQDP